MKVLRRALTLVVLSTLVVASFLIHSYVSSHSVNYSAIQRVINMNNNKYTRIPSSKPIIRIQSWNIKADHFKDLETIEDSLENIPIKVPDVDSISFYTGYKESSWSLRRFGIVNDVIFNNPDIFCVQDAMKNQLDDLDELLRYQWKWLGVGADDAGTGGEHNAIFIKRSTFNIIKTQTIWLTETPYEISQYPDAFSKRIATIVRLRHKVSGDTFSMINTHWDLKSEDARQLSANLIRYIGSHELEKYGHVFLTGDLNCEPVGKTSTAYRILTGENDVKSDLPINSNPFKAKFHSNGLSNFKFNDLMEMAPKDARMGHLMSMNGWSKPVKSSALKRVDFIMGGVMTHNLGRNDFEVLRFKTGENLYDYGVQLSDHRPLIADVVFY